MRLPCTSAALLRGLHGNENIAHLPGEWWFLTPVVCPANRGVPLSSIHDISTGKSNRCAVSLVNDCKAPGTLCFLGKGVAELLGRPCGRGMVGDGDRRRSCARMTSTNNSDAGDSGRPPDAGARGSRGAEPRGIRRLTEARRPAKRRRTPQVEPVRRRAQLQSTHALFQAARKIVVYVSQAYEKGVP